MFYSRDVRFNEEQAGVEKEVCSEELDVERHVELELSEEVGFEHVDGDVSSEAGDSEPI